MTRRLTVFFAFIFGLCLMGEAVKLPVAVPCGTLVEFVKTTDSQRFVDLEKAAGKDADKPSADVPEELLKDVAPENGMCFAIFTFKVEAGRSLSKFDYILESDNGMTQSCLDMGRVDGNYFDFRLQAQEGPEMYRLVFHCPDAAYEARLKTAFPNISLPPVGDFIINERPAPTPEPAPAAAPAAEPAAAAPAAAAPAAK